MVFCHNDVLLDNIIVTPDGDSVRLIDFEYGGFNYQAFDIGNHFNEFAGRVGGSGGKFRVEVQLLGGCLEFMIKLA